MDSFGALFLIILSLVVIVLYRRKKFVDRVRRLPCPYDIDYFGLFGLSGQKEALKVKGEYGRTMTMKGIETMLRTCKHQSGLVTFWDGPYPFVVVMSPESAEIILRSKNLRKNVAFDCLRPWLGDAIFTTWASWWKKNRTILTPIYHSKIIQQIPSVVNSVSDATVNAIRRQASADGGFIRDIREIATRAAFDIIYEVAAGYKPKSLSSSALPYYLQAVQAYRESAVKFATNLWKPINRLSRDGWRLHKEAKALHSFTNEIVNDALIRTAVYSDHNQDSFVHSLIREHTMDRRHYSRDYFREELDTFLFKGHESTSWTLVWTLFALGHHPNIQRKLQEEIDQLFQKKQSQELTLEDLKNHLPYLTAVIKESMRLYPAVPVASRRIDEDIHVGQYIVPAGCQVYVSTAAIHRNPLHWKKENEFIPERFLDDDTNNYNDLRAKHPHAYLPFSLGPRSCLGDQFSLLVQKALIANIVRNFTITSLDRPEDHTPTFGMFTRTTSPVKMKIESRVHIPSVKK